MSGEQRRIMGYLCMTQGGKAGVALCKAHRAGAGTQVPAVHDLWLSSQRTSRIGMCIAPIFGVESVTRPKSACVSCASTGNIWPRTTGVLNRVPNVSLTEISPGSCAEKLCGCRLEPAGCGLALCGVKGEKMKQLGNLAVVCAQRPDVLMQIYGSEVSVHVGEGRNEPSSPQNGMMMRRSRASSGN